MNNPDQEKWDNRYQQSDAEPNAASALKENLHLLPKNGRALDLACGLGGNAILLSLNGLAVEAWDISPVAIEKLNAIHPEIKTEAIDITPDSLPENSFDVIVVSYYLDRELAPAIINALKPNGLLFYETFNQNQLGRGPSNPDYRLKNKELLKLYKALKIIYYREEPDEDVAMLVARK